MKKFLALVLTLALCLGLAAPALAASTLKASEATTTVEKKLAELQTQSGFRPGDANSNCFTFAMSVTNKIFGIKLTDIEYHGEKERSSTGSKSGCLVRIGRCYQAHSGYTCKYSSSGASELNTANVKSLLTQAKCGDIIQTTRKTSAGHNDDYANKNCETRHPHTMVVQSVGENSLVVYEGNMNGKKVNIRSISYADFASKYNHTITLFRAENYDEINGGSSSSTTTADTPSTLTIAPTTQPGENLPQGKPFYFKGKITSNYPVTSATISILSPDGRTTHQTRTINPNASTVDIATSGLDALKFGQLAPGSYLFYLTVTDQSGKTSSWQKGFSIAGAAPAPTTPAPATPAPSTLKISLTTEPDSRHVYNTPFSLEGTITSNYNIAYTYVAVKDRETGRAYLTRDDSPLVTTYNIKTSILNDLRLDEFAIGSYTLELLARDTSGKEARWQKDFSILRQAQPAKPQEPEDTGYTITINYYIDDKLVFTDHSPDGTSEAAYIYEIPETYRGYTFRYVTTNPTIGMFGTELWIAEQSSDSSIDLYANSDGSTSSQEPDLSYEVVIRSVDETGTVLNRESIFVVEGNTCYTRPVEYDGYALTDSYSDYDGGAFDPATGLFRVPAVYYDGTITLVYSRIQADPEPTTEPTAQPLPETEPEVVQPAQNTDVEPSSGGGIAYASTQSVNVDGVNVQFEMYALKDAAGNATNYIKLRDLAEILDDTDAQFSVVWTGVIVIGPGKPYRSTGSEMNTPYSGDQPYQPSYSATMVEDRLASLAAFCITDSFGGGYTYYKLRDLGQALDFNVGWSASRGVYIDTDKPYDPSN